MTTSADLVFGDQLAEVFDSAAAEQAARARACDARDLGTDYVADGSPARARPLLPAALRPNGRSFSRAAVRVPSSAPDGRRERGLSSCVLDALRCLSGSGFGHLLAGSKSWIGCAGITVEIACLYTSCECASRRSKTQKLSNQVIIPCSLTPLTRKMVTGVLFFRTWFKKTS